MVGKWTNEPCSGVDEVVNTFWVLTDCPLMCEGRSSSYGRWTSYVIYGFLGVWRREETNWSPKQRSRTNCKNKKYITSIMDEESSDHMDEAGIPMLVSGYNIIITMGSKIWGLDIYRASNTEWGRISIYGRGRHTHARINVSRYINNEAQTRDLNNTWINVV